MMRPRLEILKVINWLRHRELPRPGAPAEECSQQERREDDQERGDRGQDGQEDGEQVTFCQLSHLVRLLDNLLPIIINYARIILHSFIIPDYLLITISQITPDIIPDSESVVHITSESLSPRAVHITAVYLQPQTDGPGIL